MFPGSIKRAAPAVVARWRDAARRRPELVADVIGMGGVLAMQPRKAGAVKLSPEGLAYEAGRRDLALELLTLMGASTDELKIMMEISDEAVDD